MRQDDVTDIYNLCAKDPDAGIAFVQRAIGDNPGIASEPLARFAQAMALMAKGLLGTGAEGQASETPSAQQMLYLEQALQELRGLEEDAPGHFAAFGSAEMKPCKESIRKAVVTLERHRPGRASEILGPVKIRYDTFLSDMPFSETLAHIMEVGDSDPDIGLSMLGEVSNGRQEVESLPFFRLCKFELYARKGYILPLRRSPRSNIEVMSPEETRRHLNLTDNHLDLLESALCEIREINAVDPEFSQDLWQSDTPMGPVIDTAALVLEKFRPGRVQEILGKTKLYYFGRERIKVLRHIDQMAAKPLLYVFFSCEKIARSALAFTQGTDDHGKPYLECFLYERSFEDLGPDDTLEAARSIGSIRLVDDGSFLAFAAFTEAVKQASAEERASGEQTRVVTAAAIDARGGIREATEIMPAQAVAGVTRSPQPEPSLAQSDAVSADVVVSPAPDTSALLGNAGQELVCQVARGLAALADLRGVAGAIKQLQDDRARTLERLRSGKALLRLAAAVACLILIVVSLASNGLGLAAFLGLPMLLGLAVILFRLDHMVWLADRFHTWVERSGDHRPASSGWLRKIFVSAYLRGFHAIGRWTGDIKNRYCRAGLRLHASLYWAGMVLIFDVLVVWVGLSLSCILVPLMIYSLATSRRE